FAPATPTLPAPPPTASTLRVRTWNIQSGKDLYGNYVQSQQAQFVAAQHPDVVVLEEVSRSNGDDGPKYRDALQAATGQTWYYYEALGAQCANNAGCIVEEILSRFPFQSSATQICYPSAFGQVQINVNGVGINVFS